MCEECGTKIFSKKLCNKHYYADYYRRNKEKVLGIKAKWRNANRAIQNKLTAAWYQRNKARKLCSVRNYQVKKKAKLLSWADAKAIRKFYLECPKGYHVDHIIPLQGKNVCGLHVIWNLQYLPAAENLKKSNKYG